MTRSSLRPAVSRRFVATLLMILTLTLLLPATASAQDSAGRKLGRGLANVALGVLAIPGEIMVTSEKSGPFVGATWGLIKGTTYMAATEVVGIFEMFTCPFETPPGFKPIMEPEFPWEYFTKGR